MRLSRRWTQSFAHFSSFKTPPSLGSLNSRRLTQASQLFFDPISVAKGAETPDKVFDWLAARIRAAVAAGADRGRHRTATQRQVRLVEIPVCYDPEFALDIDAVARRAAIPSSEVIRLHSAAEYRVACIGFVPGFPFLAGLPKRTGDTATGRTAKQIPPVLSGLVALKREFIRCAPLAAGTHRSHTIALVRSPEKSTRTFARRRTHSASAKSRAMNLRH